MTYSISKFSISVPGRSNVTAETFEPESAKAIFVFAHGVGADMNHSFMLELAGTLAEFKIATFRFNFLYMEQGKKRPDSPALAHEVIAAAIAKAQQLFPELPLFAGGKSFGGRMTSQLMAAIPISNVKGLIFVGFPLHPTKKPSVERASHLSGISVPMLFLQGTKDALAEWHLINQVCKELPRSKLICFEGADHSFKMKKQNAIPFLADAIAQWITENEN